MWLTRLLMLMVLLLLTCMHNGVDIDCGSGAVVCWRVL